MIGSKGDLKQGILGALTAGFMHPMKAGFNKLIAHGVTPTHGHKEHKMLSLLMWLAGLLLSWVAVSLLMVV